MLDKQGLGPLIIHSCRFVGIASVLLAFVFTINNFLTHGGGWPGVNSTIAATFGGSALPEDAVWVFGAVQVLLTLGAIVLPAIYVFRTPIFDEAMVSVDAERLHALSSFIIRAAFWGVFLVGLADAVISFLRVEGYHVAIFGQDLATQLGLSAWRGIYVHIPLLVISLFIAMRDRSVSFAWLILLVVIAELLIVLARFVFAYEQTFMGDLVRFWYAALFLFASAYTLREEGHVRVDVIFAGFTEQKKAWSNLLGTVAFGIPLCWVVLLTGMSGKASLINSPILSFETSMSGFGMYVKYLMAGFLIVFALSMLVQFTSYFFKSLAVLSGENEMPESSHTQAG